MATVGYTGAAWDTWWFTGAGGSNMIAAIPVSGTYTMPEAGYITAAHVYAAGYGAYADAEIFVSYNGSYVIDIYARLPAGTKTVGGQSWVTVTPGTPVFLPKGATFSMGFWRSPSENCIWSTDTQASYQWDDGVVSTAPSGGGSLGSHTVHSGSAMGAYVDYTPAAPILGSLSSTSGHIGDVVQLYGNALSSASAVKVNGVSASFTIISDTQLSVTIPVGAGAGSLSVTNPYGTTSGLSWTTQPTWSSTSVGSAQEGASVTLTGSGFTGASAVTFNGVGASFTVTDDSHISATVPAGATYGAISVTANGSNCTTSAFGIQDTISGVSPAHAAVGQSVTITGAGFSGATSVTFNGVGASFTISSHTQIVASVPSGATSGAIRVTVGGGYYADSSVFTPVTRRVRRTGVWVFASAANFRRGGVWTQPTNLETRRGAGWAQNG